MSETISAFIEDLQSISDTDLVAVSNAFRRICKKHNYKIVWLHRGLKSKQLYGTVVTPDKYTLFVKRFRSTRMYNERKKLDILIPHANIIGLPKVYGITDDWVVYKYIKGVYAKLIKRKGLLFEAIDHLLCIHKMPTGSHFVQHSFFRTKVLTPSWKSFAPQIPKIAKTIERYGAPVIASEQLLMLLDRLEFKKSSGWIFTFPDPHADAFNVYDFVLCHGCYMPKHLFRTRQGIRVVDWETVTLFSRWYDVWRFAAFASADLTDLVWSRYIQGYLT